MKKLTDAERLANKREANRRWREANREKARAASSRWHSENRAETREDRKAAALRWRQNNPEKVQAKVKRYRQRNADKVNTYYRDRYATPAGRLERFAREQLRRAIERGAKKTGGSQDYLGCDAAWLVEVYLPGHPDCPQDGPFHIDHVKPLSAFELTDGAQLREACHWSNLRPLSPKRNLAKASDRASSAELERHLAYVSLMQDALRRIH